MDCSGSDQMTGRAPDLGICCLCCGNMLPEPFQAVAFFMSTNNLFNTYVDVDNVCVCISGVHGDMTSLDCACKKQQFATDCRGKLFSYFYFSTMLFSNF